MSVTTAGPYVAGSLVRVASWYLSPQGLLADGFKDSNGNPADPSTVTLKWRTPDGQTHTASFPTSPVVRSPITQGVSAGLFQADLDTTALPGVWWYEWQAPAGDPVQSIAAGAFTVNPPAIP